MKKLILLYGISIFLNSCTGDSYSLVRRVKLNDTGEQAEDSKLYSLPKLKLDVDQYMSWIEDTRNGLLVKKVIDNLTFSAMYKPYEYLAIQEEKKDKISKKELDEKIEGINGLQYFNFRIEANNSNVELLKTGITNQLQYFSRIEYCSFKMQDDIKLVEGTDTLDCVLFHFERVYGIAPYATFVLGFPIRETTTDTRNEFICNKTLMYEDKIFNVGKINLTIKKENISNIPDLITG